jgi:hypothetical protein
MKANNDVVRNISRRVNISRLDDILKENALKHLYY